MNFETFLWVNPSQLRNIKPAKEQDFKSHMEQSNAEFDMYEQEIKDLKEEINEKQLLLEKHKIPEDIVSLVKYNKLKREMAKLQEICSNIYWK